MSELDGDAQMARRIALYFDGALIVGIVLFMIAGVVKPDNDMAPPLWKSVVGLALTSAAFVFVALRNTAALLVMAVIWAGVGGFFVVGSFTESNPRFLIVALLFVVAAELHWSIRRKTPKV